MQNTQHSVSNSRRWLTWWGGLCLSLALSACVSLGLPPADRRDVSMRNDDNMMEKKCQQAMDRYNAIGNNVECVVFNAAVLLVGQARQASDHDQALAAATAVAGVRRVVDEITIGTPAGLLRTGADGWITGMVKTGLLAHPKIKFGDVKVETVQGVVYLMGILSNPEADVAVDIARNTGGVRKVVDITDRLSVR